MTREENVAEWLVILNPNSGSRKGIKVWSKIVKELDARNVDFILRKTKERGHAIQLVKDGVEAGCRKVIVIGGDGTLNEVVNGVFQQRACPTTDVQIGLISLGTGNDWGRMYDIPKNPVKALRVILKQKTFIQDACSVDYKHSKEESLTRYFLNMAGLGYDALVTKRSNDIKDKGYGGKWIYYFNVLLGLFIHRSIRSKVCIDGKEVFSKRIYSMNVGICKYNGGGLPQLPYAVPNDGKIDITIVGRIKPIKIAFNFHKLVKGTYTSLKEIQTFKGKQVDINTPGARRLYLEADGESLGYSPMTFKVVPKALCVIVNKIKKY
ncbi:MAG: diacylglycerol kinase family protein [Hyphomicrobiales bacterium]